MKLPCGGHGQTDKAWEGGREEPLCPQAGPEE